MTDGGGEHKASHGIRVVFISYASQDVSVAFSIVAALERDGVKCWIAPRDVVPGTLYADEIVRAINEAAAVVLILSSQAVASPHVGKEIERASSKRRRIIVLRTDSAPLTRSFEYFLSESQWIEVGPGDIEAATAKLVEAVRSHIVPSAAAEPRGAGDATAANRASTAPRSQWMVVGGVALVSVALAYFVADKFWLSKHLPGEQQTTTATSVVSDKTIAVLPFTDMSEKKDQEYFADGMAEEILDLLVKIPGLMVIGRTSSFQFKGKNASLREIGAELHVAHVLEGSVRKSGEQVRITVQLINTRTGTHEWSETYDQEMGDVLKMQDRIATGVVRALQVTIGADELHVQPLLESTAAYDLYLRGRHAIDRYDKGGFESGAGYFQQALQIDPKLVRAAEWLAAAHEFTAEWGFVPAREGYEQARASVERALKLNARSALAHSLMCTIHLNQDRDWAAAAAECDRALALEPRNPHVLGYAGQVQVVLGQWDEAARLTAASIALDPLDAGWRDLLATIRDRTGRLADAEAERRKVLEISPTYERGHLDLGLTLLAEGSLESALASIRQETSDGGRDAGLAMVYHALGRKAEADTALARFTSEHANDRAFRIAQIHAYRGDGDSAFNWLDRAYRQKDVDLWFFVGNLPFRSLESDPRYKAFLRTMKLRE